MPYARLRLLLLSLAALLAGCGALRPQPAHAPAVAAAPGEPRAAARAQPVEPEPPLARFRCEGEQVLVARFEGDSVRLEGWPAGPQLLLRDAGGATPAQSVFSNAQLRAEFGLGPDGREALLHSLPPPPEAVRCTRI